MIENLNTIKFEVGNKLGVDPKLINIDLKDFKIIINGDAMLNNLTDCDITVNGNVNQLEINNESTVNVYGDISKIILNGDGKLFQR